LTSSDFSKYPAPPRSVDGLAEQGHDITRVASRCCAQFIPSAANAHMWLGQIWRSYQSRKIFQKCPNQPHRIFDRNPSPFSAHSREPDGSSDLPRQMFRAEHQNHGDFEPHTLLDRLYDKGRHCTAEPAAAKPSSKSPTRLSPPACHRLATLRRSVARRPSDMPSKIGDKSPPTLAFVRPPAKMPSVG
jgi:hypothetical protein